MADLGETRSTAEVLLGGSSREGDRPQPGLLDVYAQRATRAAHEFWVLDAGAGWSGVLPRLLPPDASVPGVTFLSFERLKTFRENFLQRLNTMAKDLGDADAVSGYLRKADISKWCPPEVATQPGVQQFLRSVSFVNGALIYGNSFVEWTASEAFRRARPSVLVAQFGTRPKPKPLTSVAVFENQELASPLPSVEDIPGSAIDAQILARYVWLAAGRYPQYQSHSACVCISENLGVAYAVAPPGFPLGQEREPITLKRLSSVLNTWLT